MNRADVIIVGAGAAGLTAAAEVSQAGRSVLILDARERIGGRIWTLDDRDFGVPVEMGAEFIHGRPAATFDLVRKAKLTAYDLPFEQHQRRDGKLVRMADDEMTPVMKRLAKIGNRDMSFAEFLRRDFAGRKYAAARQAAADFVEGFDAADSEKISAKSLAEEQEGLGDIEDETQFRLLEGYGGLAQFLHESLDRQRTEICLGTIVEEIEWQPKKLKVICNRAGKREVFESPQSIITLPLGVLKREVGRPGAIRFMPEVPDNAAAMALLEFGPVVKAVIKFRDAFWESKAFIRAAKGDDGLRDASFLHHSMAAFPTWWTMRPLRLPILTGWAGGPKAAALSGQSRDEILEAAVESLCQLFKLRRSRIESLIEKSHVYDWLADPFSAGAYSYVAVGGAKARRQLARPVEGTLFFAGEATDTAGQASTVAGAIASGRRAAREVLNRRIARNVAD